MTIIHNNESSVCGVYLNSFGTLFRPEVPFKVREETSLSGPSWICYVSWRFCTTGPPPITSEDVTCVLQLSCDHIWYLRPSRSHVQPAGCKRKFFFYPSRHFRSGGDTEVTFTVNRFGGYTIHGGRRWLKSILAICLFTVIRFGGHMIHVGKRWRRSIPAICLMTFRPLFQAYIYLNGRKAISQVGQYLWAQSPLIALALKWNILFWGEL